MTTRAVDYMAGDWPAFGGNMIEIGKRYLWTVRAGSSLHKHTGKVVTIVLRDDNDMDTWRVKLPDGKHTSIAFSHELSELPMATEEFRAWTEFMRNNRGRWTIDPIHDGVDRDLIAVIPDHDDYTRGAYIAASGPTIWLGKFADAFPHIGDGALTREWGMSFMGEVKEDIGIGLVQPGPKARDLINAWLGTRL